MPAQAVAGSGGSHAHLGSGGAGAGRLAPGKLTLPGTSPEELPGTCPGNKEVGMIAVALVLAVLAALLHVYIFVMESVTWTSPKTRATFGLTAAEAEQTKVLAFNQGFYNLFLAVVTALGVILMIAGQRPAGAALLLAGAGSMAAAALVLVLSARDKWSAALKQGVLPLLCVIALVLGLLV